LLSFEEVYDLFQKLCVRTFSIQLDDVYQSTTKQDRNRRVNSLYSELRWLPPAPKDFSDRLKALGNSPDPLGRELQALAQHGLNLNQLTKLAKAIARIETDGRSLDPLVPFRLAVLSNSTVDLVVPALVASAARRGIALEVIQPSYAQVAQEALTPDSKVNSSKPDAVLFALDFRALPLKLSLGNFETSAATVDGIISYLRTVRDGIKANSNAVCIFQSFAPPVETLFGNLDRALPGSMRSLIDGINRELTDLAFHSDDVLLDVAGIAETVGLANWHDPQLWNLAKISFSDELIPFYADHVARVVAALRG
jgi:predicted enzyme involved in methoxymalonyl-ACP biosynthesis